MTDSNNASAPAADVLQALVDDITSLMQRSDVRPRSIGEAAQGDDYVSWHAQELIDALGSVAAVEGLNDKPHRDENFDWSGIGNDDRPRVAELLRLISSDMPAPRSDGRRSVFEVVGLDEMRPNLPWCQPEYRTIGWRILRLLALDPTRPLDRRSKPERLAAAIMWVALTASDEFAQSRRMKPSMLWKWFDVSSCTSLGRKLGECVRQRTALLVGSGEVDLRDNPHSLGEMTLGDSSLLHSTYRRSLLEQRDELLERIQRQHQADRDAHPVITEGLDGRVGLRARPVTVRWAMRGADDDTGRACVSVVLGESLDNVEVLGLSIPDARRLIQALQVALDAPVAA